MALPNENNLVKLGPWGRGANNVAREDSVPRTAYREGVNVDTYPGGKVRRRPGFAQVDASAAYNFWSDGYYALQSAGTTLYRFIPGQARQALYAGLRPESTLAYEAVNQFVYVSDGARAMSVNTTNNQVIPWGVQSPSGQPALAASSGGGMDAGSYQVAITYARASGEESGTGVAAVIAVAEGGGIALTGIPQPSDNSVTKINIYMTSANGAELKYYGSIATGVVTEQMYKQNLGVPLKTQHLIPMPAGHMAAFSGGRLYVAVGNLVVWSEPLMYGLFDPRFNYLQYAADIDLLAPTATDGAMSGCFIAAGDRTYFLAGEDPLKWNNLVRYGATAVQGSLQYLPGSRFQAQTIPSELVPVWLASNGYFCLGMPDGSIDALTEGRFAASIGGGRASAFYRDYKGVPHMVVAMQGPGQASQAACDDDVVATVVRNGVAV